jgi:hypothetical protein
VALPCFGDTLRSQSVLYRALNRHYVTPDLLTLTTDLATTHPGSVTLTLDAGFPFTNLPLLPHLSHDDGEKLDLAVYWENQPGRSKSPIGYFGYASGPTDCPTRWADLRWDMALLNTALPNWPLDAARMKTALTFLANDPRTGQILIEPHIPAALTLSHPKPAALTLSHPKIRFQGCRAARHDDHIHMQL